MRNYEEREKEVMVENQQLRKSIYTTLVALREFQHAHKLDTNAVDTNNAAVIAGDDNATAQTHTRLMMLPFEAVRDRIEEEMQFAIDELAVAIGELRVRGQNASTQGSATEKQVSALRGQLGRVVCVCVRARAFSYRTLATTFVSLQYRGVQVGY